MKNWTYLCIEDPTQAALTSRKIMPAVFAVMALPGHQDAAVFSRIDDEGLMHFYFSPQAATVGASFGAAVCAWPARESIGKLLVGNGPSVADRLYQ